jgi:hypothetical protein
MLFQVHIIFTVKIGCYKILQKKITVLQIVTSFLFCGYDLKKNRCKSGRNLFFSGKSPGMLGTGMLGMTTVELAKKLNLAQPTISQAAMRGRKTAEEE